MTIMNLGHQNLNLSLTLLLDGLKTAFSHRMPV